MKRGITKGIVTVCGLAALVSTVGAQALTSGRDADALRSAEPARVGDDGMREAVSTMLIAEAEYVGRAADDRAGPREQSVSPILEMMYEAMDDVLDGLHEDAIPKLEAVLKAEPTLHPVWSTLGWAYWSVGREEDAIALWERLLALNPGHPLPHTHLGNAYAGLGEMALAERYLDRAAELDPTEIRPRLLLGALYRWTARYEKSIAILNALLVEHPDRLDVKLELALSLYNNRQYEDALPLLSEVSRWHPDNEELALAEARSLLHTGRIDAATRRAEHTLAREGDNIEVLMLLADAPRYKDSPADAIPYLERILRAGPEDELKAQVMRRLVELYARMYSEDPINHPLDRAIELARELVRMEPDRPEWRIAVGELNLMRFGAFPPDATPFEHVLEHSNANSLRAHLGLFELYQASRQYRKAIPQLELVRELTGDDPYHPSRETRFELSRGSFRKAYEAIDRLEARGAKGAVAILLYRELSTSDWSDRLSVRRFRLQLLALKQTGYRFIKPDEIPRYLRDRPALPSDLDEVVPDRVVVITFDDASPRTLELADEVARDLDIVMAMHLPVARIERGDPLVTDWATIRRYAETGRWVFGSYLLHASERVEQPDGFLDGAQIANRLWDADAGARESDVAFERRIRREYARSRDIIRRELGADYKANFVAFPYGDMGQGLRSDMPEAIAINLREAAINYEIGFIESPFAHAMREGNPLLYPRYAPDILDSAEDVIAHLTMHHPLVMARRLRLETAALEGRPYRALRMLELLERDGYPPRAYARSEAYAYQRMSRRLGIENPLARSHRSFFDLVLASPYAGARFEYFRDNADRRNWETRFRGGIDLTAQLQVEGHAGYGNLRQEFTVIADEQGPSPELDLDRFDLSVRERHAGVSAGVRFDPDVVRAGHVQASAFARRRQFRGDADFDRWAYGLVLGLRPFLVMDLNLGYAHNVEPSARALVKQIHYEAGKLDTVVRLRDWWDLNGAIHYSEFSDDNDRINSSVSSIWELSERAGLLLGLQYMFHHSTHPRDEYWTPNKLHQGTVMLGLKNRWRRFAYDARGMVGRGRQDVRKRDIAAYEELVIRAEELQFDAGDRPRENWEWIVAGSLTLDYGLGRWADAFTTLSYNRVPGYNETRATTGLRMTF